MNRLRNWIPWQPTPATLIAAAVVVAGILLTGVSWWFLILVGLGTFGPGVLRELGWLRDKDEWQQRAAHRAGYHAFLVAGLVATVLVAYVRSGDRVIKDPEELATFFLVLTWTTWFFSSLFSFWGARKTAMRILVGYGAFWLVFVIASNVGAEWQGPLGLLMSLLIVVPFFGLAYVARRWPRIAGVLLLVTVAAFVKFFGWYEFGRQGQVTQLVTMILFLGPLLGGGVALLGERGGEDFVEVA